MLCIQSKPAWCGRQWDDGSPGAHQQMSGSVGQGPTLNKMFLSHNSKNLETSQNQRLYLMPTAYLIWQQNPRQSLSLIKSNLAGDLFSLKKEKKIWHILQCHGH